MNNLVDKFVNGELDDALQVVNRFHQDVDKHTPYTIHQFRQKTYHSAISLPEAGTIIPSWQSNVGAKGSVVQYASSEDESDRTIQRKQSIKNKTYRLIYTNYNWSSIENEVVELIAKEGNAVLMFNSDGDLIVHSIFRFHVYYDSANKKSRYAFLVDNQEVEGMKNLEHGVDIFHIKDPLFASFPIASCRIDLVYAFILMQQKAVSLNTHLFANGWFSNVLLKMNQEVVNRMRSDKDPKTNKSKWELFMDKLNDTFRGVMKVARVGFIPGLEDVIELGKSPKDAQFIEMLKLTPERLAWAYSMTPTDLGVGGATTYNNVATFNDRLYDLFGSSIEAKLDEARNEWLLPYLGINTTEKFYIEYNKPDNPNRTEELKMWADLYKTGAISPNEFREKIGFVAVEGGEEIPRMLTKKSVDEEKQEEFRYRDATFTEALSTAKTTAQFTLSQTTEESDEGQKFLKRWDKAIKNQIKSLSKKVDDDWVSTYKALYEADDEDGMIKLIRSTMPKIESNYAFNVLNADLLYFAGIGVEEYTKHPKAAKEFSWDGEYPASILTMIEDRTEMLLKGVGDYQGLDHHTSVLINSYLKKDAASGEFTLAQTILGIAPELAEYRARTIARTEIANAVSGSQFRLHTDNGATSKKLLSLATARPTHKASESQGWISINELYSGGFNRSGEEINCRCADLFGYENEHL